MDRPNEYTFATGITVKLKRVSPFLVNELDRVYPAPQPPKQTVELDGVLKEEENPADPDYLRALAAHRVQIHTQKTRYIARKGVEADPAAVAREVARVRAEWRAEFGAELEEQDDLLAYLKYVCAGMGEDWLNLVVAIMNGSQPTEEGITAAANSFQGDVSGT